MLHGSTNEAFKVRKLSYLEELIMFTDEGLVCLTYSFRLFSLRR